jgi:hypothetical protein
MAHCRLLQWRFANARAGSVSDRKLASAEVELMGTWASVSEMSEGGQEASAARQGDAQDEAQCRALLPGSCLL